MDKDSRIFIPPPTLHLPDKDLLFSYCVPTAIWVLGEALCNPPSVASLWVWIPPKPAVNQSNRFFIALLPPLDIQIYANQIKQYFAERYSSRAAQKSPPHITLQPPFGWLTKEMPALKQCLNTFAHERESVPVILSGFAAFPPRVIYINVLRTQELLALQTDLIACLETGLGIIDPVSKSRAFSPHMTVAFRDLTRQNFKAAWQEFQQRPLYFEFTGANLTLLIHDGKRWNVRAEFPFVSFTSWDYRYVAIGSDRLM